MTALTTEAEFYDTHAATQGEDHPLYPMWRCAASWLDLRDPIFDLGCGAGGLALALTRTDWEGDYVGMDFSESSLELATLIRPGTAQSWEFVQADLRDDSPWDDIPGDAQFVMLEVLEHLEDDLSVIQRWVPPGHRLVFSVPNFHSTAHQRVFSSPQQAYERYSPLLTFTAWRLFALDPPPGRAVHLFDTRVRGDVWR